MTRIEYALMLQGNSIRYDHVIISVTPQAKLLAESIKTSTDKRAKERIIREREMPRGCSRVKENKRKNERINLRRLQHIAISSVSRPVP